MTKQYTLILLSASVKPSNTYWPMFDPYVGDLIQDIQVRGAIVRVQAVVLWYSTVVHVMCNGPVFHAHSQLCSDPEPGNISQFHV